MSTITRLAAAAICLAAGAAATPAFAEGPTCNVPAAERQPVEALKAKLEAEGWKIANVKTDEGCYEVYAHDAQGRKVEVYFDPKTFAKVGEDE